MKNLKYLLFFAVSTYLIHNITFSQRLEEGLGLGLSFGTAMAKTDVGGYIPKPITRIFSRYHTSDILAFEAGFGFGMVEGKKIGFFSSKIIPIDIRFNLSAFPNSRIRPYFFSGISLMNFNPVDENERKLPRNARGDYSKWMGVIPSGAGIQYFITNNSIIELTGMYALGTKDYLDDRKINNNNDGYFLFGLNVYAFFESGNADSDGDQLKNKDEKQFGTDPNNPDTDGDRLKDGEEVFTYLTNPLKRDTDDDGLSDYDEIFLYRTNPNNADTDGDGLIDGDEIKIYKTDPLIADTDKDGLNDGEEVLTYKTDPLNADTDEDGLTDGEEVLQHKTDPLKKDSDEDGLTDYDEVRIHVTDPLNKDTDNGGIPDGKEVEKGKNPNDPTDDVVFIPDVGQKLSLRGINFEFNSARLLPSSEDTLKFVAAGLLANPEIHVEISGHTDNIGSAKSNELLSLRRSEAVKSFIVSRGVAADRITTVGYGFSRPISDNVTEGGRAKNRRVEFLRIK
ncbi:MAG: OmpA family protein [Bacteroidota bacterium]|nr:OmpA family protein [Bacteroidota bacterium]